MTAVSTTSVKTRVFTPVPERYLARMCRHFSHKVDIEWSESEAKMVFSIGSCFLTAGDGALDVTCEAPDDKQLEELMEVIKSHFDRFAVADSLVINWP